MELGEEHGVSVIEVLMVRFGAAFNRGNLLFQTGDKYLQAALLGQFVTELVLEI